MAHVIGVAVHLHSRLILAFEAAALPGLIGSFVLRFVRDTVVLAVPFIEAVQLNVRQQG